MRLLTISIALFAVSVLAEPKRRRSYCLDKASAEQVADNFGTILTNYSDALADAFIAPDYKQYSTSSNALWNECSGTDYDLFAPIFSNRKELKQGQPAQSGQQLSGYVQLDFWYSCDTVIIRFQFENGPPVPSGSLVGMTSLRTTLAPPDNEYPYYVHTAYIEWDLLTLISHFRAVGAC